MFDVNVGVKATLSTNFLPTLPRTMVNEVMNTLLAVFPCILSLCHHHPTYGWSRDGNSVSRTLV